MIKEILAYAFRKLSSKHHSSSFDVMDVKITLLFDLGISSEEQIDRLLKQAQTEGLVEIVENKVIPRFDYMSVEIPVNLKKLASSLTLEENLADKILERISEITGDSIYKLKEELEKLQKEYPIFYPEVLAIYLAFVKGVDVSEFLDMVKNAIKSKNLEFDQI
jgi:hypothetical protein